MPRETIPNDTGRERPTAERSRVKSIAFTVISVALLLSACGGSDADEGTTSTGGDSGGGASCDGDIELTVWFARDYYLPEDSFESFQEEHPNIAVSTDVIRDEDQLEQLLRASQAGQPLPDVIQMDGFLTPVLWEANLIRDITPYVDAWESEDPEQFEQLANVVWEAGTWDGNLVGMADRGAMDFLFYRTEWFAEADIEPGFDNWAAALDGARQLKATRPDDYPWGMKAQLGEGINLIVNHMVAAGVPFEGAVPDLTSEEALGVIEFYQTLLADELLSPDTAAWGVDEYLGAFIGDRVAITQTDMGAMADFTDGGLTFPEQFDVMTLPIDEGGGLAAPARNWMITSGSECPEEASLVFRYLMEEDNALQVTLAGGEPPWHVGVLQRDEFIEAYPAFKDDIVTAYMEETVGFPIGPNFPEVESILEEFQQDMLQNPDTPAHELAQEWQAELDAIGS